MGACTAACAARGPACLFCANGSEFRPLQADARSPRVLPPSRRPPPDPERQRRGKANARKGKRLERAFAHRFGGARVPLSGALDGHPGDVILEGWRYEIRGREHGFQRLYQAVADTGLAVVQDRDSRRRLVVALEPVAALLLAGAPAPPAVERVLAVGTVTAWLYDDRRERPHGLGLKADRKPWLVVWRPEAVQAGGRDGGAGVGGHGGRPAVSGAAAHGAAVGSERGGRG